jgi:DNA-damage-inducible protein D
VKFKILKAVNMESGDNQLSIFEDKPIRKVLHQGKWYFSIIDIIEILSNSSTPRKYWDKIKRKLKEEGVSETSPIWRQFKMMASDDKQRLTDCADTEGVLRIIMSVPSPKAEPFKHWMAQVSTERIEETENPEIGIERIREIYKAKGYPDEWIERRMQSIETRKQLTDEWKKRGVEEGQEFSILTATIAKGTFGVTPSDHSKIKGLEKQNLRDHMTPLELIFTALGEELTRDEAVRNDAKGFNENHEAAIKGGSIAGDARQRVEERTGNKIVSDENYLKKLAETNNENKIEGEP